MSAERVQLFNARALLPGNGLSDGDSSAADIELFFLDAHSAARAVSVSGGHGDLEVGGHRGAAAVDGRASRARRIQWRDLEV